MNFRKQLTALLSSHTFFSGIFVLFVMISALQITMINYNFKTNDLYYPLYITAGSFFFLIKSFLSGFNFIDRSISKNMWAYLVLHSLALASQVWFVISGLTKLTTSSYPNEFFLYVMIASSIYLVSSLISRAAYLTRIATVSFLSTTISYIMITLLLFRGNFLFLQIVTLIFLAFQVFETFIASRQYFSREI